MPSHLFCSSLYPAIFPLLQPLGYAEFCTSAQWASSCLPNAGSDFIANNVMKLSQEVPNRPAVYDFCEHKAASTLLPPPQGLENRSC